MIELHDETEPSYDELKAAVAGSVQWVPIEGSGVASASLWVNENGAFILPQNTFALKALAPYVEGGEQGCLFGTVVVSARVDD